jgi:predicted ATP-grasp superfamily ATP-dependent carboligase
MTTKYWYVYKLWGGPPNYKHPSYDEAVQEAKRLVDTVGGEYEILEAVAIVKAAPKYVVERLTISTGALNREQDPDDENIPF